MADGTIRVGIIGAGTNTCTRHIPNLQSIDDVEILEVVNRTSESSQRVAEQFGIPTVRTHWKEVATSPEIDAVVIGTWPYLHCDAACTALEHGKHVLCEARMAMSELEARKMLKASYQNPELIAQLVPSPFTLKIDETVVDYLDQRKIGKPLFFEFHYQVPSTTSASKPLHWRRNRVYSGNNIMVLGIIYESLLRWFGPAKWVSASASIFNGKALDPDTQQEIEVDIPDYLNAQTQMVNGVMGSIFMCEGGFPTHPPFIKIYGDNGTLHYDFKENGDLLYYGPDTNQRTLIEIPRDKEMHWRVEEEFINSIRGDEEVVYTTFTTGVEYMKFTEATINSIDNNGERFPIALG